MHKAFSKFLFVALISSLVALASLSDASASPTTITITSPTNGDSVFTTSTVSVTGTASDPDGIKKVEVSSDGGMTFSPATTNNGFANWSFTIPYTGSITIIAKATSNTGLFGVTSIPTNDYLYDIAVNSLTDTIYATDYTERNSFGSDQVSEINGSTNKVINTIPVDGYSRGVAVNSLTNTLYVASSSSYGGTAFMGPILAPNSGSNIVSVIDIPLGKVVDKIHVGIDPQGVAVDASHNKIYVANSGSNSISIINGLTDKVIKTIPIISTNPSTNPPVNPFDIAIDSSHNKIYVSDSGSDSISVISSLTDNIIKTIHIMPTNPITFRTANPSAIAVDSSHNKIYASSSDSNFIAIIDGTTYKIIKRIQIIHPSGVAVDSSTNTIYVASRDCTSQNNYNYVDASCNVIVINGETNEIIKTVSVEADPYGVAVNPGTHTVYVANSLDWARGVYIPPNALPQTSVSAINGNYESVSTSVSFTVTKASSNNNPTISELDPCFKGNHLICKLNFITFREIAQCYGNFPGSCTIDCISCPPDITKEIMTEIQQGFPPLKQVQAGIPLKNIVAAKGQVLITNDIRDSPASVTEETAKMLMSNGDTNWHFP